MTESISPFIRGMITRKEDGTLLAPDLIIKTLSAAYNQYTNVRQDSIERNLTYAAVEGQIGGNPPFDQAELDANGLGHIANFNNFKARSGYEKVAQGYWNLINATEVFVKVSIGSKLIPDAASHAETMARHFSDIVKEWEDFHTNFNLLGAQLVKIGISPVMLPHEDSFMWETIEASRFFIPSQSQSFISKLTNICVETTYTVQSLYQIYTKTDEDSSWNREALEDFLILRANALTPATDPVQTPMQLQLFINSNSSAVNTYFTDTVRLVNMFQQEYSDGKISHYIFSADQFNTTHNNSKGYEDDDTKDFLFFVPKQYDCIEDVVIIFTADPGEWLIHSNVGQGQKMFAPAQAINMLDCNIVNMANISATPLIRTLATGGREVSPIRMYPGVLTDIGTAEFVQNNMGANINQLVVASQYLTQGIETNTINSGDNPGTPDASNASIAPSQARNQVFQEFAVLKNVVAHFYTIFDKLVRRMFIRMLKSTAADPGHAYAEEFKRRCIEDGVPEILFDTAKKGLHGLPIQFRSVKASRVAGDGSTLARIMGLEALDKIAPTFNQKEMASYKKEWVASTVGVDYIDMFASSDDQADETSGGHSLAVVENNFMTIGKKAGFSPDNEQGPHTETHMALLMETVKGVQASEMSPVDAAKVLDLAIPHTLEHIQYMQKSPMFYSQILNAIDKPFSQIIKFAELNKKNAEAMIQAAMEKQQKDAAATQAIMDDKERKDFTARADAARKDESVAAANDRADKANQTRGKIMEKKTDADIENKNKKTEADIASEAKKGATAKGRTQVDLEKQTPEELSGQLASLVGSTPSSIDFETPAATPSFRK